MVKAGNPDKCYFWCAVRNSRYNKSCAKIESAKNLADNQKVEVMTSALREKEQLKLTHKEWVVLFGGSGSKTLGNR